MARVTVPQIQSDKASSSTVRRRSKEIDAYRHQVSGSTAESSAQQQKDEIKRMSVSNRQQLLDGIRQKIFISAEVAVAMQADADLPWNKIKLLNR